LQRVLWLRVGAERYNLGLVDRRWPYTEFCRPHAAKEIEAADQARRQAGDLTFSTPPAGWGKAAAPVRQAASTSDVGSMGSAYWLIDLRPWHAGAECLPGMAEWLARDVVETGAPSHAREAAFLHDAEVWADLHASGSAVVTGRPDELHRTLFGGM